MQVKCCSRLESPKTFKNKKRKEFIPSVLGDLRKGILQSFAKSLYALAQTFIRLARIWCRKD